MSRRSAGTTAARAATRAGRVPHRGRARRPAKPLPGLRRVLLAVPRVPLALQVAAGVVLLLALFFAVNWVVQVARKPAEMFFPVSGALDKPPAETWLRYGWLFSEHATPVITADFLAALAQVEAAGNPVARTYWRWRWTSQPFELYRPASSAVGMFQITDATFREARRYCIHGHAVAEDGPWHDFASCWFNRLYTRVVPSHAVEMTAALLDRRVETTLARRGVAGAVLQDRQNLAAIIHLCGGGAGDTYVRRGFRLAAGQRCGDHDAAAYLARLNALRREFRRIAGEEAPAARIPGRAPALPA